MFLVRQLLPLHLQLYRPARRSHRTAARMFSNYYLVGFFGEKWGEVRKRDPFLFCCLYVGVDLGLSVVNGKGAEWVTVYLQRAPFCSVGQHSKQVIVCSACGGYLI